MMLDAVLATPTFWYTIFRLELFALACSCVALYVYRGDIFFPEDGEE